MLSRVANSIYWMSRYIERAENIARFVDVNLHLILDSQIQTEEQRDRLIKVTGDHETFNNKYSEATRENVIHFLTFDRENPNSIISSVTNARENARSVREVISSEMFEQINKFYFMLLEAEDSGVIVSTPYEFYNKVRLESHLFVGITDTTMSHNEAWHFDRVGRLLERADKTSRILDVKYYIILRSLGHAGMTFDNTSWVALLKSASAFEMYRKSYKRITPYQVAQFLTRDLEFPRSMRYCLIWAQDSLHEITGSDIGTFANEAERRLGLLKSDLDYANIDEIIAEGLHQFIDGFQTRLNAVGEAIDDTYFSLYTAAPMDSIVEVNE